MRQLSSTLILLFLCVAAFAQSASRIIAFASYGADTTIPCTDSGGYNAYAMGRGGEMLFGTSYFDADYPFLIKAIADFETGHHGLTKFDSSWETSVHDTDICVQAFDAANNITTQEEYLYSDGSWKKAYAGELSYDAHNNLIQEIDSDLYSGGNIYKFIYTYDSLSRITSVSSFPSDTMSWARALYKYNATGNLILEESDTWDSAMNNWGYHGKRVIKYNSSGLPDSSAIYYTDTVYPVSVQQYYFSPAGDTMILNTGTLLATNTYDAAHNKICTIQIGPGTVLGTSKTLWTYNAFNQVTAEKYYSQDSSGSWVFTSLKRYYYSAYDDAVAGLDAGSNKLQVFPSPAQSDILLKLQCAKPQSFTFNIFNVAGQSVRQWQQPQALQVEKSLDISGLPSGVYFVTATSATQKLIQRFVIQH